MSETWHCKGVLKPTNIDTENFTEDDFETYKEEGFVVADGEIYEVVYEINEVFSNELSTFFEDSNRNVEFECVFYNGCTWIGEILQEYLEDK